MSGEMSEYERKMLELEREKLETLKGLRRDFRRYSRIRGVHDVMEEFDVDRDDLDSLIGYLRTRFSHQDDDGKEAGRLDDAIKAAVESAVDEDVTVEIEEREKKGDEDG